MSKRKAHVLDDDEAKIPEVEDNRVVVQKTLVTLKRMAFAKVAIALWYHHDIRFTTRRTSASGDWRDLEEFDEPETSEFDYVNFESDLMDCDFKGINDHGTSSVDRTSRAITFMMLESLDTLSVPSTVQVMIRKYLKLIKKQIENWTSYHHKRVFYHLNHYMVYSYVNTIIWRCDGCVDYLETAKQLLVSPALSEIEKYRVACTYCIEEQITNMSYLLNKEYAEKVVFQDSPLIYYWQCYVKGELEKIPLDEFNSVDMRMITIQNVDNKWAIEYFWNRIREENKPNVAIEMIRELNDIRYQAFMLNRLTEIQQHQVFVEVATDIIFRYATAKAWLQAAFKTWSHLRNIITEEQFIKIISDLLLLASDSKKYDYVVPLAATIWRSTPVEVRCKIFEHGVPENIVGFVIKLMQQNFDNFEFAIDVLNEAPEDLRKSVVQKDLFTNYENLERRFILYDRPTLLDRFLRCCLTTDEDIAECKNQLMEIKEVQGHFANLFMDGKLDELKKMLDVYLPDADAKANYKARILTFCEDDSRFAYTKYTCFDKQVVKNRQFLSDMLFDASSSLKKEIIRSENGRKVMENMIRHNQNDVLDDFLTLCLSENEILELKKDIVSSEFSKRKIKKIWHTVDKHLGHFFADAASIAECKIRILSSPKGQKLCFRNLRIFEDRRRTVKKNRYSEDSDSDYEYSATPNEEINKRLFSAVFDSNATADVKRRAINSDSWRNFCTLLIDHRLLSLLNHLITLCLPEDEVLEFKRTLLNVESVENRCIAYVNEEKYDDLNEFLNQFLLNDDAVIAYKSQLMTTPKAIRVFINLMHDSNYATFNKKIDQIIPTSDMAAVVKRKLIVSAPVLEKFHLWITCDKFDQIKDCISLFVGGDDGMKMAKEALFSWFKAKEMTFIFLTFHVVPYESFLRWCLDDDEQKLIEYKNTVAVDRSFLELLQQSVFVKYDSKLSCCRLKSSFNFVELNRFLEWYFVTQKAVKEFKIQQITVFRRIEMIGMLLKKKDKSYVKTIVSWFFDNNRSEMLMFKKKNPNNDISNLIE